MQIGCCVDVNWLPLVVDTGFDYAELRVGTVLPDASDEDWQMERERILGHGIPIRGFNVLLPGGLSVVGPSVEWDRLEGYVHRTFHRMRELGGQYLSFGSGGARRVPDGFSRQRAEEQLHQFVGLLGQVGMEHGIRVNVEFLNRKETNIILSLLEAKTYVERANRPSVKLLADLYHMMEESEPLEDLYQVGDDIGYVHVADTGRRYPGSGQYPYAQFVSILREVGYQGPVSVECNWGDDIRSEMQSAAAFLRSVF